MATIVLHKEVLFQRGVLLETTIQEIDENSQIPSGYVEVIRDGGYLPADIFLEPDGRLFGRVSKRELESGTFKETFYFKVKYPDGSISADSYGIILSLDSMDGSNVEWSPTTIYDIGDGCRIYPTAGSGSYDKYESLFDDNQGNDPRTDTTNWKFVETQIDDRTPFWLTPNGKQTNYYLLGDIDYQDVSDMFVTCAVKSDWDSVSYTYNGVLPPGLSFVSADSINRDSVMNVPIVGTSNDEASKKEYNFEIIATNYLFPQDWTPNYETKSNSYVTIPIWLSEVQTEFEIEFYFNHKSFAEPAIDSFIMSGYNGINHFPSVYCSNSDGTNFDLSIYGTNDPITLEHNRNYKMKYTLNGSECKIFIDDIETKTVTITYVNNIGLQWFGGIGQYGDSFNGNIWDIKLTDPNNASNSRHYPSIINQKGRPSDKILVDVLASASGDEWTPEYTLSIDCLEIPNWNPIADFVYSFKCRFYQNNIWISGRGDVDNENALYIGHNDGKLLVGYGSFRKEIDVGLITNTIYDLKMEYISNTKELKVYVNNLLVDTSTDVNHSKIFNLPTMTIGCQLRSDGQKIYHLNGNIWDINFIDSLYPNNTRRYPSVINSPTRPTTTNVVEELDVYTINDWVVRYENSQYVELPVWQPYGSFTYEFEFQTLENDTWYSGARDLSSSKSIYMGKTGSSVAFSLGTTLVEIPERVISMGSRYKLKMEYDSVTRQASFFVNELLVGVRITDFSQLSAMVIGGLKNSNGIVTDKAHARIWNIKLTDHQRPSNSRFYPGIINQQDAPTTDILEDVLGVYSIDDWVIKFQGKSATITIPKWLPVIGNQFEVSFDMMFPSNGLIQPDGMVISGKNPKSGEYFPSILMESSNGKQFGISLYNYTTIITTLNHNQKYNVKYKCEDGNNIEIYIDGQLISTEYLDRIPTYVGLDLIGSTSNFAGSGYVGHAWNISLIDPNNQDNSRFYKGLINQPTRPTTEVLIDELEDNGDKWYVNFKDDGYMELPVWEAPIGSIMSYHININEYNQEQYILDSVDNSVFLKGTADGLWSFDDTAMIIKVNGREIINGYVVPYDTNLVMEIEFKKPIKLTHIGSNSDSNEHRMKGRIWDISMVDIVNSANSRHYKAVIVSDTEPTDLMIQDELGFDSSIWTVNYNGTGYVEMPIFYSNPTSLRGYVIQFNYISKTTDKWLSGQKYNKANEIDSFLFGADSSNGKLYWTVGTTGEREVNYPNSTDTQYDVRITFDTSKAELFIDGIKVDEMTTTTGNTFDNFMVGALGNINSTVTDHFTGSIYNLSLVDLDGDHHTMIYDSIIESGTQPMTDRVRNSNGYDENTWTVSYKEAAYMKIPNWAFETDDIIELEFIARTTLKNRYLFDGNVASNRIRLLYRNDDSISYDESKMTVYINGFLYPNGSKPPLNQLCHTRIIMHQSGVVETVGGSYTGTERWNGSIMNIFLKSYSNPNDSRFYTSIIRQETKPITLVIEDTAHIWTPNFNKSTYLLLPGWSSNNGEINFKVWIDELDREQYLISTIRKESLDKGFCVFVNDTNNLCVGLHDQVYQTTFTLGLETNHEITVTVSPTELKVVMDEQPEQTFDKTGIELESQPNVYVGSSPLTTADDKLSGKLWNINLLDDVNPTNSRFYQAIYPSHSKPNIDQVKYINTETPVGGAGIMPYSFNITATGTDWYLNTPEALYHTRNWTPLKRNFMYRFKTVLNSVSGEHFSGVGNTTDGTALYMGVRDGLPVCAFGIHERTGNGQLSANTEYEFEMGNDILPERGGVECFYMKVNGTLVFDEPVDESNMVLPIDDNIFTISAHRSDISTINPYGGLLWDILLEDHYDPMYSRYFLGKRVSPSMPVERYDENQYSRYPQDQMFVNFMQGNTQYCSIPTWKPSGDQSEIRLVYIPGLVQTGVYYSLFHGFNEDHTVEHVAVMVKNSDTNPLVNEVVATGFGQDVTFEISKFRELNLTIVSNFTASVFMIDGSEVARSNGPLPQDFQITHIGGDPTGNTATVAGTICDFNLYDPLDNSNERLYEMRTDVPDEVQDVLEDYYADVKYDNRDWFVDFGNQHIVTKNVIMTGDFTYEATFMPTNSDPWGHGIVDHTNKCAIYYGVDSGMFIFGVGDKNMQVSGVNIIPNNLYTVRIEYEVATTTATLYIDDVQKAVLTDIIYIPKRADFPFGGVIFDADNGTVMEIMTGYIIDMSLKDHNDELNSIYYSGKKRQELKPDDEFIDNEFKYNQMISNGDFSSGMDGWSVQADVNASVVNGWCRYEVNGASYPHIYRTVPVTGNGTGRYVLSFDARKADGSAADNIKVCVGTIFDGCDIVHEVEPIQISGTTFTYEFVTGTADVVLQLGTEEHNYGQFIEITNFSLTQSRNMIDNGNFRNNNYDGWDSDTGSVLSIINNSLNVSGGTETSAFTTVSDYIDETEIFIHVYSHNVGTMVQFGDMDAGGFEQELVQGENTIFVEYGRFGNKLKFTSTESSFRVSDIKVIKDDRARVEGMPEHKWINWATTNGLIVSFNMEWMPNPMTYNIVADGFGYDFWVGEPEYDGIIIGDPDDLWRETTKPPINAVLVNVAPELAWTNELDGLLDGIIKDLGELERWIPSLTDSTNIRLVDYNPAVWINGFHNHGILNGFTQPIWERALHTHGIIKEHSEPIWVNDLSNDGTLKDFLIDKMWNNNIISTNGILNSFTVSQEWVDSPTNQTSGNGGLTNLTTVFYGKIMSNKGKRTIGDILPEDGSKLGTLFKGEIIGERQKMELYIPTELDYTVEIVEGALPDGVYMTNDGKFYGIPKEVVDDKEVKIKVTTVDSEVINTYTITVLAGFLDTTNKLYVTLPRMNREEWRKLVNKANEYLETSGLQQYRSYDKIYGGEQRIPSCVIKQNLSDMSGLQDWFDENLEDSRFFNLETVGFKSQRVKGWNSITGLEEDLYDVIYLELEDKREGINYFQDENTYVEDIKDGALWLKRKIEEQCGIDLTSDQEFSYYYFEQIDDSDPDNPVTYEDRRAVSLDDIYPYWMGDEFKFCFPIMFVEAGTDINDINHGEVIATQLEAFRKEELNDINMYITFNSVESCSSTEYNPEDIDKYNF